MPSAYAEQCTFELHLVPAECRWGICSCPLSPIFALSCPLGICTGKPTLCPTRCACLSFLRAESWLGHFTCGSRNVKFSVKPGSTRCSTVQLTQSSAVSDPHVYLVWAGSPCIRGYLSSLRQEKKDMLLFSREMKSWRSAKYHVVIKSINHSEIPRKIEDL